MCDVSEELSRQFEDILNTYCVDDGQEGVADPEETDKGPPESRNGETEAVVPEVNGEKEERRGAEDSRSINETDKDQKRVQDKKKSKGLGEYCTFV